jgi:hypothetical protein
MHNPLCLVACSFLFGAQYCFVATQLPTTKQLGVFFIPKSQGSLANLAQAVTLGKGATVLLYSIKSAYKSRQHEHRRE